LVFDDRDGLDRVRTMSADDVDLVFAWRNDPAVRTSMFSTGAVALDEHRRWFDAASADPRRWLLLFESDGVPRGFVDFAVGRHPRVADWGFYAAPDAPPGTGRRLGRTALAHAFGPLGLHKVCGDVLAGNPRSIALHRKLGFVHEGTRVEHHFDGQRFQDVVCFGLLDHQWHPSESTLT
jgi:UDP-4-amino-4,6-dideoxy-N-acetyl-beta-L-altrosamine N-acetyltransferase